MDKKEQPSDTFHVDVRLPDGTMFGQRHRDGAASLTVLRPAKEGRPMPSDHEFVRVTRGTCERELKLESLNAAKGPAKVTTRAYRDNYETVFGAKRSPNLC